jgi:polyhydroxybutyrate depolymerase
VELLNNILLNYHLFGLLYCFLIGYLSFLGKVIISRLHIRIVMKRQFVLIIVLLIVLLLLNGCNRIRPDVDEGDLVGGAYLSLEHDGKMRNFYVYVPESYNGLEDSDTVALVINFHGGAGNGKQQCMDSKIEEVADEKGFIVVCPDGTSAGYTKLYTWNTKGNPDIYAVENNVDDIGFIKKMIFDLESKFKINPRQIYATGISQGGMMSYRLACEEPNLIAAIAPVSSSMETYVTNCNPRESGMPIIIFHGLMDEQIPFEGGQGNYTQIPYERLSIPSIVNFWITQNNLDLIVVKTGIVGNASYNIYGSDADLGQVILWTLSDGGHTWPGGSPSLSSNLTGGVNMDISASEEMWNFFEKHPMPNSIVIPVVPPVDVNDPVVPPVDVNDPVVPPVDNNLLPEKDLGPGEYNLSLEFGGRVRTFYVYAPSSYDKKTKLPLVMNLHGGFGNGPQQCEATFMKETAENNDFIVACPTGTSKLGIVNYWNDGYLDSYAVNNNVDDVGFIEVMINDLSEKFYINEKKVYSTGISNGGIMSYRFACEISNKITAIAPVAGSMMEYFDTCNPTRKVPVIIFHGLDDTHIPYNGGIGEDAVAQYSHPSVQQALDFWIEKNGVSSTPIETGRIGNALYEIYGTSDSGGQIVLWTLEGGGHTWPGGDSMLDTLGTVNQDIDASQEMWDFFKQFSIE